MRTLLSWIKRLFRGKQKPAFHPWRIRPEMDLVEFREREENIHRMRALFLDDFFQQVLVVLHNARPRGYPPRGQKSDAIELALELGRIEGYESALAMLELLTKENPKQEELHATWANPDNPDTTTDSTSPV